MATLNTLHGSTWRTTRVTLRTRGRRPTTRGTGATLCGRIVVVDVRRLERDVGRTRSARHARLGRRRRRASRGPPAASSPMGSRQRLDRSTAGVAASAMPTRRRWTRRRRTTAGDARSSRRRRRWPSARARRRDGRRHGDGPPRGSRRRRAIGGGSAGAVDGGPLPRRPSRRSLVAGRAWRSSSTTRRGWRRVPRSGVGGTVGDRACERRLPACRRGRSPWPFAVCRSDRRSPFADASRPTRVDVGLDRAAGALARGHDASSVRNDPRANAGTQSTTWPRHIAPDRTRRGAPRRPTRTVTVTDVRAWSARRPRRPASLRVGGQAGRRAPPAVDAGQRGGVGRGPGPAGVDDVAGDARRWRPSARRPRRPAPATSGTAWPRRSPPDASARVDTSAACVARSDGTGRSLPSGAGARAMGAPSAERQSSSLARIGGDRGDGLAVVEVHHPHAGGAAALRGDLAHLHADRDARRTTRRRSRRRGRP